MRKLLLFVGLAAAAQCALADGSRTASASLMITVTIPAKVQMAKDGRSLSTNLGTGSGTDCTLSVGPDDKLPDFTPKMNATPCRVVRLTREQVEAGGFRGWTVLP